MAAMERHGARRARTAAIRSICALLGLIVALALVGCGDSAPERPEPRVTADRPAPPEADFPSADGRTLGEVVDQADPRLPTDPVVTPLTQVFEPGPNRMALTLADRDFNEITEAELAIYIAPTQPKGSDPYGGQAIGPFVARLVSLAAAPEFRSDTALDNPYSATAFYLSEVDFPRAGEWRVEALIRDGDRLIAKSLPRAAVGAYRGIPSRGQRPPAVHTPTAASAGGNLSQLTTRQPPGDLQAADFAEALGERPVALLFTSPGFCQSRVCAPVADVAEQVGREFDGQVEVIHMDIYKRNDPDLGVRRQVRRFNLPSDTWLFVVDADGTVRQAVEGPFGLDEMRSWLEEAARG